MARQNDPQEKVTEQKVDFAKLGDDNDAAMCNDDAADDDSPPKKASIDTRSFMKKGE